MTTSQARVTISDSLPPFTSIERTLYAALERLGVTYRPQHPMGRFRVDAYLPSLAIVLEADGEMYHGSPEFFDALTVKWHEHKRAWRDRTLLQEHRVLVIHLWGAALETDEMAYESVAAALAPYLPPHLEESESHNGEADHPAGDGGIHHRVYSGWPTRSSQRRARRRAE